jgi:O-antigen/teichoic acid export membrane protein
MKKTAREVVKEFKGTLGIVFGIIRKRDFSGNRGQAVKDSSYNLATLVISKIGALLFTVILARMLMPELFGLYLLALSTILIFSTLSELGVGTAMLTFVSKSLGEKDPNKAKTYFIGLLKYKVYLIAAFSLLLLASAYLIANTYYNKPIFLALLAGALYIPIVNLQGYLTSAFQAESKFQYPLIKEVLFQILRIALVPIVILFILKFSPSVIVFSIILTVIFCHFIALSFLKMKSSKKISFLKGSGNKLSSSEKKRLKKFILPLSLTVLSGMFFAYIDTLMLGHFVESTFIGYYGAALGFVGSAAAIIGFIPGALLPIFSRLKGRSLESAFEKTRKIIILVSIPSIIFVFLTARYISMIYGSEYSSAVPIIQLFSLLLLIFPLAGLYNVYLTSRERTSTIAKLLVFSTILNIILNFLFITYGLRSGMMQAVMGATLATIISRVFYLLGVILLKKKRV